MSTRANIILKEENDKLYFYRHSDGYPEGALPLLNKFRDWIKTGKIRNNIPQGAGWLILLGAMEYNAIPKFETNEPHFEGGHRHGDVDSIATPSDWKAGSIEPTTGLHGDIEYLYVINVEDGEIDTFGPHADFDKIEAELFPL